MISLHVYRYTDTSYGRFFTDVARPSPCVCWHMYRWMCACSSFSYIARLEKFWQKSPVWNWLFMALLSLLALLTFDMISEWNFIHIFFAWNNANNILLKIANTVFNIFYRMAQLRQVNLYCPDSCAKTGVFSFSRLFQLEFVTDVRTDVRKCGRTDVWTYIRTYGVTNVRTDIWICGRTTDWRTQCLVTKFRLTSWDSSGIQRVNWKFT